MTLIKVQLFALLSFLYFSYSAALICYQCEQQCKNVTLVDCNPLLANHTTTYLKQFYQLNITNTSYSYECLNDNLILEIGNFSYKGCVYGNVKSCQSKLLPGIQNYKRSCVQCSWDKCNSAATFDMNAMTVLFATVAIILMIYNWHK